MNLKDNNKCSCDKEQKKIFGSPESELGHLSDKEPQLTKILQDKDKRKEFQLFFIGDGKKTKGHQFKN